MRVKSGRDTREKSLGSRVSPATDIKRDTILAAARKVFESEGLQGASLRAIAAEADYTPAALYFHFDSKEALYAELLAESLATLRDRVSRAVAGVTTPADKLRAASQTFFDFYAENPRDLDLGFYLFRGGMKPQGLGKARDKVLNAALYDALAPIGEAAEALGASRADAKILMANVFAHAAGLLLLDHTQRIRIFGATARTEMRRHIDLCLAQLAGCGR